MDKGKIVANLVLQWMEGPGSGSIQTGSAVLRVKLLLIWFCSGWRALAQVRFRQGQWS